MVYTTTKRGGQEVLRGAGGLWSLLQQKGWAGGVERSGGSVVTTTTKRGRQEVLRGAGGLWSELQQRGAGRRC